MSPCKMTCGLKRQTLDSESYEMMMKRIDFDQEGAPPGQGTNGEDVMIGDSQLDDDEPTGGIDDMIRNLLDLWVRNGCLQIAPP
ncbi:hypothetical protein Taro_054012 [Colocasia esculenta]|uniref:Uncharacterized protein n=1 Tax=Colocasia esculenta TaxID=4460 RepID=A0A843XP82_COLES|nr:hypothetical protein [Colocasia esculenta]